MAHAKLQKPVVLYMPASVNKIPRGGFGCGVCMMGLSDTKECTILDPAKIDLEYGVCGLFVPGKNLKREDHPPMEIVSKKIAGYSEAGPTYCGSCRFFDDRGADSNICDVVEGQIDYFGCCNHWELSSSDL